jgi:hypothetical protein|tara:strand:+ start:443 stop:844 length:402 start_codon:yes stop_codon:yes gene_type:complete
MSDVDEIRKIENIVIKARPHFEEYVEFVKNILKIYTQVISHQLVEGKEDCIFGEGHENVMDKLEEISRDCCVFCVLISRIESSLKTDVALAERDFDRFIELFELHKKKVVEIDKQLEPMLDRMNFLEGLGVID